MTSNPLNEDNSVRGYTLSLVLAIQLEDHLAGLLPTGDSLLSGSGSRHPGATFLWCKPRESKSLLSIHFVQSRNYYNPWDPTTSITAYFTQLDQFQVSLGDCGIAMSEEEKTMAAGAQMWNSKMFTKDQMVAWENKTAAQQTWKELQR